MCAVIAHCRQRRGGHGLEQQTSLHGLEDRLLFGSETRVFYRRHVRKLEQFHMRCLRRIAHIRWQDKRPNTEVLQICNISGIEALTIAAQFRWTGHVI